MAGNEFIDPATVAVMRARRERQTLIGGGGLLCELESSSRRASPSSAVVNTRGCDLCGVTSNCSARLHSGENLDLPDLT
jgi:hypothetical protein